MSARSAGIAHQPEVVLDSYHKLFDLHHSLVGRVSWYVSVSTDEFTPTSPPIVLNHLVINHITTCSPHHIVINHTHLLQFSDIVNNFFPRESSWCSSQL